MFSTQPCDDESINDTQTEHKDTEDAYKYTISMPSIITETIYINLSLGLGVSVEIRNYLSTNRDINR